jgi:hypothetical protein
VTQVEGPEFKPQIRKKKKKKKKKSVVKPVILATQEAD